MDQRRWYHLIHSTNLFQTCQTCRKKFGAIYKLKMHSLIHSTSPPFVCSFCQRGSSARNQCLVLLLGVIYPCSAANVRWAMGFILIELRFFKIPLRPSSREGSQAAFSPLPSICLLIQASRSLPGAPSYWYELWTSIINWIIDAR